MKPALKRIVQTLKAYKDKPIDVCIVLRTAALSTPFMSQVKEVNEKKNYVRFDSDDKHDAIFELDNIVAVWARTLP